MEEYASNQKDFIFNGIEILLDKQQQEMLWYMEKFFTEDEMKNHSENILQIISKSKSEIPFIKMQLLKREVNGSLPTYEEINEIEDNTCEERNESYAVIGEWTESDGTEKWDVIHMNQISYEEALKIAHYASKFWSENVPYEEKHLPHSAIPIKYELLLKKLENKK